MNNALYLVVCNGYLEGYGEETYCLGIFDSKEQAENAVKECTVKYGARCNNPHIINVVLNDLYRLTKIRSSRYANQLYLGGYVE